MFRRSGYERIRILMAFLVSASNCTANDGSDYDDGSYGDNNDPAIPRLVPWNRGGSDRVREDWSAGFWIVFFPSSFVTRGVRGGLVCTHRYGCRYLEQIRVVEFLQTIGSVHELGYSRAIHTWSCFLVGLGAEVARATSYCAWDMVGGE